MDKAVDERIFLQKEGQQHRQNHHQHHIHHHIKQGVQQRTQKVPAPEQLGVIIQSGELHRPPHIPGEKAQVYVVENRVDVKKGQDDHRRRNQQIRKQYHR
ncbi:hypothetical protein D3C79_938720 [compost metagenome]